MENLFGVTLVYRSVLQVKRIFGTSPCSTTCQGIPELDGVSPPKPLRNMSLDFLYKSNDKSNSLLIYEL